MEREKYINLFVEESKENLLALNEYLLELEKGSGDLRLLNDIFRVAHTLKGMSATMGFKEITELTHEMENLLDFLRNAQLPITSEIIDVLFLCLDSLEILAENVISTEPVIVDITNLMHRLKKLVRMGTGQGQAEESPILNEEKDFFLPEYSDSEKIIINESFDNGYEVSEIEVLLMKDSQMKAIRVLLILQAVENKANIIKTTPSRENLNLENFGRNFIITLVHAVPADEIKEAILSIAEVLKVNIKDLRTEYKLVNPENINTDEDELYDPFAENNLNGEISSIYKSSLLYPVYNDTEKSVLIEAINQNYHCFEVYISLLSDTIMKFVRVNMVLQVIDKLNCQIIRSSPPSSELINGKVDDNFVITLIAQIDEETLKNEILTIGEISQVEVLEIVRSYLTVGVAESTDQPRNIELPELTDYEKLLITEAKNSGKRTVLLGVHLMPGTIMKFARFVLVSKKLESLGEIIKTIPPQSEIEAENFGEDFQVLFVTDLDDQTIIQNISNVAELTNIVDLLSIIVPENNDAPVEFRQENINSTKELKSGFDSATVTEASPDSRPKSNLAIFENYNKAKIINNEKSKNPEEVVKVSGLIAEPLNEINFSNSNLSSAGFEDKKPRKPVAKKTTIRVDIDRLDELINLVEELVIVRSRLTQIGLQSNSPELVQSVRNLSLISGSLQNNAMRLRMMPVEHIFNRFPRMIRDIAKSLDKEINFVIEGEETELDRTIIDEIGDPLVHLLRNSADHGIENSDKRIRAGKNKAGNIRLIARHEGNNVLIIVEDDGGGVNIEKVKQKAIEKSIITIEQAENITNEDALKILFLPGFSTIDQATDISGRGVGMDAVMSKVKSIGGDINIISDEGIGTRFTIKLPLTLAIMEVLLVRVGNEIYAVPITYIEEVRELLPAEIKSINKTRVIIVRDRTIPLVDLAERLQVQHSQILETVDPDIYEETIPVIIVRTEEGKKTSGLIVNSIIGQEDVVIKSLGRIARDRMNYISGTANLGNGNLGLILNITGLT